jgi:hypothetical protein
MYVRAVDELWINKTLLPIAASIFIFSLALLLPYPTRFIIHTFPFFARNRSDKSELPSTQLPLLIFQALLGAHAEVFRHVTHKDVRLAHRLQSAMMSEVSNVNLQRF